MASHDPCVLPVWPPPDLRISTASAGEALVCTLAGNLHTDTEEQVRQALDAALGRGPTVLAVDLSAVRVFTSSGLNALLVARSAAHVDGVPLVLVAPSRSVRRVLEITGTDELFPIRPAVEQALRHRSVPLC